MRTLALLLISACNVPPTLGADGGQLVDAACPVAKSIFLNRSGGTYIGAETDDSRQNETRILDAGETSVAPPATYSDAQWTLLIDCVASKFAPFQVLVTDDDPGTLPHIEMVVTDRSQVIGTDLQIGTAVSALCDGNENVVGFAFSEALPDEIEACLVIVSALGIAIGLDHVSGPGSNNDLMGGEFPEPTTEQTFVDGAFPCGQASVRHCICTGEPTQNSYQQLLAHYGPRCGP